MVVVKSEKEMRVSNEILYRLLVENETYYLNDISNIRIFERDLNSVKREAKMGSGNYKRKTVQALIHHPYDFISLEFQGEGVNGKREIKIKKLDESHSRVNMYYKVDISDVPKFVEKIMTKQLIDTLEQAMHKLTIDADKLGH